MRSTAKRIWNILTSVLVVLAVLLAVLLVGARLVGLQVFTVLSGSMEPTYHTGSLIYVKKVDATKLSEGTVITFMLDEDTIATHRIVGVVPDEQDPTVIRYRTKGDANESEDGGLVHYKNVIGTPVFTIPKLGYLANYIQHPPGSYVAISIGALILLLMFLPELLGMFSGEEKKQPATPNQSPAKYPQGARRIRKAAKPPTAARRVRLGKEEGSSEEQLSSSEGSEMKRVSSDADKPRRAKKKAALQSPVRETTPSPSAPERSPAKHVSAHAAAAPAKRTKRKGGAHCAK